MSHNTYEEIKLAAEYAGAFGDLYTDKEKTLIFEAYKQGLNDARQQFQLSLENNKAVDFELQAYNLQVLLNVVGVHKNITTGFIELTEPANEDDVNWADSHLQAPAESDAVDFVDYLDREKRYIIREIGIRDQDILNAYNQYKTNKQQ